MSGWTNMDSAGNFTLGTSQSDFTSCPSSLAVDAPQQGMIVGEPHIWLQKTMPGSADVTIELDALLPKLSGMGSDGFAVLMLRGSIDPLWSIRLERSTDTAWFLRVHEGGMGTPSAAVPNLLLGAWNHLTLAVHFSSDASAKASLTYQTTSNMPSTATVQQPTVPPMAMPVINLYVGASATSITSQEWIFKYDSVVVTAK